MQRDHLAGKTWFHAGDVLPNEEHEDAAVRVVFEEICLPMMSTDDLTMLRCEVVSVRIRVPDSKTRLVYDDANYAPYPYVSIHLRTPSKVE
jgi:hypothetical protein